MRKLRHEEIPRFAPSDAAGQPRHPRRAIADNIRSLHNVGSFFRTADVAWIEGLILSGFTGTPDQRGVHKTALGAQHTIPWEHVETPLERIRSLKKAGYTVAALELTDTPRTIGSLNATDFPLCLIVGNEVEGVQDEVLAEADFALEIPQFGTKQSLNVSVAFGVALLGLVNRYRTLASLPLTPNFAHQ